MMGLESVTHAAADTGRLGDRGMRLQTAHCDLLQPRWCLARGLLDVKTRRLAGGESCGQCTLRKLFRPRVWVSGSAREAPGPLCLHSSDVLRCGSLAGTVESAWARAGATPSRPTASLGGEGEKRADAHRRAIEQGEFEELNEDSSN